MTKRTLVAGIALVLRAAPLTMAQLPKSAKLFDENCVSCHANVPGSAGPSAGALRRLTPESIVAKLGNHGNVSSLADADKIAIAEYLSARSYTPDSLGQAMKMPNVCKAN